MKRALVWVVCMVACAVPELDRTGHIRCGVATEPNGGCPDGYACNADRCCPSGVSGCPALPPACEGQRVAACPAGSPPAACSTPIVVGRPCSRVGDCTGGTNCASLLLPAQFPGGYCASQACTVPAARTQCEAGGGTCLVGVGFGATGTCVMRCSLPVGATFGRCRADQPGRYICARVVNSQINETLCIPDCETVPSLCGSGSRCDLRTHLCVGGS